MTRPTFEVADVLRVQGDRFLDRYRSSFGFQQLKAFRAILRCRTLRWAVIAMPAPVADIRLSHITRAETGTVPSARHKDASAGWRPANANS